MEPLPILYVLDFIDVFAVIIAIYVGPIQGATFALIWNIYPRLCGAYRPWQVFFKDGGVQAFICLFMPFIHMATGSIVISVLIFSILRIPLYLLVCFMIPHRGLIDQLVQTGAAGTAVIIVNGFYAKLFGNFFTNLLQKGTQFSWILFLIATATILLFSIFVLGFSPKKATKKVGKHIRKVVKNQIRSHQKKEEHHDDDMQFIKDTFE